MVSMQNSELISLISKTLEQRFSIIMPLTSRRVVNLFMISTASGTGKQDVRW